MRHRAWPPTLVQIARADDHLAELLPLPLSERAKAAQALLESLDHDGEGDDDDADQAQIAELVRRMGALEAGSVELVDADDARARVMARLRAVRGR